MRLTVWGGSVREVYGVLIAEAGDVWRSRVLTYPNMLWSVPGGRGTMKFSGASAQEVQAKALDYIRRHCDERGVRILEETVDVETAAVEPEAAAEQMPSGAKEERLDHSLMVRYGESKTTMAGRTADLSYGGLFIVTDDLLPKGRRIKMLLQLDQFSIPLQGIVAWRRQHASGGKRRGMGIELSNPPSMYARYVEAVKRTEARGAIPAAG